MLRLPRISFSGSLFDKITLLLANHNRVIFHVYSYENNCNNAKYSNANNCKNAKFSHLSM
jgi:hypothetical protein